MIFNALGSKGLNKTFEYVQTSEIVGPAVVNMCSMVIPRTLVDYSRNEQAGKETGRREVLSFTNSTFVYPAFCLTLGSLMNKYPLAKAMTGLGIVSAIGFGLQFYNRYLTKKETGSDAFVGLPNYAAFAQNPNAPQQKENLVAKKIASIASILLLTGASITGKINPIKIAQELKLSKLANETKFLTLNQLKAYFGLAISGRILASSDNNELRETNVKDFPAFVNWLVLGGFVSKLTAYKLAGKELFANPEGFLKCNKKLNTIMHIIKEGKLKTHNDLATDRILKGKLNTSLFAGILYSGLALGLFIPVFNKRLTNKLAAPPPAQPQENTLLKNAKQQLGYV